MRILLLTDDFSGASLAARLRREGHEVRAHVANHEYRQTLDGWIKKIPDLGNGLDWAGKEGLILCDDNGFGPLQDSLRSQGYSVIGGSAGADLLENDREHAQKIFSAHGLKSIPTFTFISAGEAAEFVDKNGGGWVVKRNGHADKTSCYVGCLPDGRDTANLLRNEALYNSTASISVRYVLQRRVIGVEIGVARYFNGHDWVGPVEINVEHKNLFPGDLGPKTYEMGTLLWYDGRENNRLFQEVLAPLKPYLRETGFRGDVDINCMVNEEGAWPMEATTRFGYPAVHAQMALHETPWGEFLKAVADGRSFDLQWRNGYAVAVFIAVPPFPYCSGNNGCALNPKGLEIHFREPPHETDWPHIHFEDVRIEPTDTGCDRYIIAGATGYVMHVTGNGPTVEAARAQVYRRVQNIVIPRMYYRADIGERLMSDNHKHLSKWADRE